MKRIRVGVIRGGPSAEYEVSLKTGAQVLASLSDDRFIPIDIFIDKSGQWHIGGFPITLSDVAERTDILWNALHGEYGEDGKVQAELDRFGIKYTGSGALASAVGMNKALTKSWLESHGILMAKGVTVSEDESLDTAVKNIVATCPMPVIVKPMSAGSSIGVHVATDTGALREAINIARKYSSEVLVEEFIAGREATCCVVEASDKNICYALYPVEIIPPAANPFFDFDAKYNGQSQEICPGDFTVQEMQELRRIAVMVHQHLGLKHYSRTDFIVSPKGIYMLEVNTLPGLTEESLLPKSLKATGVDFSEFLDHIIGKALND